MPYLMIRSTSLTEITLEGKSQGLFESLPAILFALGLGPGFLSVSVYLYLVKQLAKQNTHDGNEN